MTLTRSPLEPIGMNGAGVVPKRRSARLSAEGAEENEPPTKKNKANGVETTSVSTKEQDGGSGAVSKRKRAGKFPRASLSNVPMHETQVKLFLVRAF